MRIRYRGIWLLDVLFLFAFAVLVMLSYSSLPQERLEMERAS